jgi:hypothetical protein|tara:strand:- start:76 stop:300 length:225 start_codon:yes stop_codon:yes gene_type:complete
MTQVQELIGQANAELRSKVSHKSAIATPLIMAIRLLEIELGKRDAEIASLKKSIPAPTKPAKKKAAAPKKKKKA